jgi:opacity protein-like surface antigen
MKKILLILFVFVCFSGSFAYAGDLHISPVPRPYFALRNGVYFSQTNVETGGSDGQVDQWNYGLPIGFDFAQRPGNFDVAFGLSLHNWDWEIEYEYAYQKIDDQNQDRHTIWANGVYNFRQFSFAKKKIHPFVGVGLGWFWLHGSGDYNYPDSYTIGGTTYNYNHDRSVNFIRSSLCFNAQLGLAYQLTDHIQLDLRYRYSMYNDVSDNSEEIGIEQASHSILFGVKFELW